MPEINRKPNKAIVDFVNFKVTEVYGSKPLMGTDLVFLNLLKRALCQRIPTSARNNSESTTGKSYGKSKSNVAPQSINFAGEPSGKPVAETTG